MAPGAVLTRPLGLDPEPSSGERSEEDCPSFGKWRGCFSSAWDRILHLLFLLLFEPGFEGRDLWTCTWGAKALGVTAPMPTEWESHTPKQQTSEDTSNNPSL